MLFTRSPTISGSPPSLSGTTRPLSAMSMPSSSPAASPTAITSAAGPSPSSRPSWRPSAGSPPMAGSSPADGGRGLGVCNGFQILVEAGLLPGALIRNRGLKFICRELRLSVATTHSPFTSAAQKEQVLRLPIAHGEGCYIADERTLDELEAEDRVAFRYIDNANGSLRNTAGILNRLEKTSR